MDAGGPRASKNETGSTKLVIGASGFLGSHVTRQLVAAGEHVRVMLRHSSSTVALDDLDVERCYGDVFNREALRLAMDGCDVVYYCVVDTRAWLRDPAPLFSTNLEGLRNVLDIAVDANLLRFVFTSTVGTLANNAHRAVTESEGRNWSGGGPYIASRVAAEQLLLEFAREKGLPAVALCISTTYGPGDWAPTPHGRLVRQAALGRMLFYPDYSLEVVGVEDAARAMLLAAEHGRVGERYIVSDRYLPAREVYRIAASAAGRRAPRLRIPMPLLKLASRVNDIASILLRTDLPLAYHAIQMVDVMSPLDHGKAVRELGWDPKPVDRSIHDAALFFLRGIADDS